MKKFASLLLISAAFVMASCGNNNPTSSAAKPSSEPASSAPAESSAPVESSEEVVESSEEVVESSDEAEESSDEVVESSGEVIESDYVVKVNGVTANVAVVTPSEGTDKGVFELALEGSDVVTVSFDETAILFAGYDGVAYESAQESFLATEDGNYKFYINAEDVIWVVGQKDHSGEVTVDLYTKFNISDDQVNLVAYAWFFSNETDGVWTLATHVAHDWEAANNRHYTISVSDPVGKYVVLALFNADSGVTAEAAPTSWEGVAVQSGDGEIQDWGNSVGVDLY